MLGSRFAGDSSELRGSVSVVDFRARKRAGGHFFDCTLVGRAAKALKNDTVVISMVTIVHTPRFRSESVSVLWCSAASWSITVDLIPPTTERGTMQLIFVGNPCETEDTRYFLHTTTIEVS